MKSIAKLLLQKLLNPKKIEQFYHDILLKVENLLENENTNTIPVRVEERGADQYVAFHWIRIP